MTARHEALGANAIGAINLVIYDSKTAAADRGKNRRFDLHDTGEAVGLSESIAKQCNLPGEERKSQCCGLVKNPAIANKFCGTTTVRN
ncbi:hypothetical protein JQ597_04610 [Bradyrhizobium sp. AUGA SZCCT0177]|uniref:hypothetical protein n=1 Tax=Bradyrhizobium sp. AUGA SZCCT0177 TaxID=2807665 RepID=UPI001BA8B861|nr:hypothetical protein [Bradyrhizobium sp. AUGA SZCCT0177]MBR1281317.1 hypothetical protein [Bradyrhizobium sp. AUGA SZCCT0177]